MERVVLVTGATGYVGGRLVAALETTGHRVRCLARRPETLHGRVGAETEVVQGDCLQPAGLTPALLGVHTAYYLVHSMGAARDFAALDREAAREFGRAAREAGIRRIIYLGGLGEPSDDLSAHLKSRQETGDVLRQSGVPVVEFRASVVIGSGSLSFEMVRALVERLPVLICPKWVAVAAQPIGIEDLIGYLVAALELPEDCAGIFPIGGPDVVSYGDIMREYARQRGLRRWFISVPVLTPRLSSLWLGLVTPLYARVGRKLIDGLKNPTIVRDDSALRAFSIRPRSLREAIGRAASLEDAEQAATRWSDALSAGGVRTAGWGGARLGTRIVDSRAVTMEAPPSVAFAPVRRIGGAQGWYCGNALWRFRGFLDLLVGGIGMRRGRRDPEVPHSGDALDFWRVEAYEPDRLLRLAAEMKIPGRAWLQFEVTPQTGGGSEIRQTAIFDPAGLAGLLYWYALYPLHTIIFRGMLAGIAARASSGGARPPRHITQEVLACVTYSPDLPSSSWAPRAESARPCLDSWQNRALASSSPPARRRRWRVSPTRLAESRSAWMPHSQPRWMPPSPSCWTRPTTGSRVKSWERMVAWLLSRCRRPARHRRTHREEQEIN